MKLAICKHGEVKIYDLEKTDNAYDKGGEMHPGWVVKGEDWEEVPGAGGEHILMSMYEGFECAGSYLLWEGDDDLPEMDFSWAVLPENSEESEHLRVHCMNTLFRKPPDDDSRH